MPPKAWRTRRRKSLVQPEKENESESGGKIIKIGPEEDGVGFMGLNDEAPSQLDREKAPPVTSAPGITGVDVTGVGGFLLFHCFHCFY